MNLDSMIAVLEAAKRGEAIEKQDACGHWSECINPKFSFPISHYRIAPKKERNLVEQLRAWGASPGNVIQRAANRIEELEADLLNSSAMVLRVANDRIEQLEMDSITSMVNVTTDELLAELKRRTT